MATYDSKVIYEFADILYRQAARIIAVFTAIGVLIGAVGGYPLFGTVGLIIGAVIVGAIGYFIGQQKAFALKLQAQTALCQAKIEENTQKK